MAIWWNNQRKHQIWKPDATDEDVIEAAKAAHVHHFIQTLPKGYDMVIDEESNNISQGQNNY